MIVLGSTGSIGINVLNIAKEFNLQIEVLSAGKNIQLLNKQIKEFHPKFVVISEKELIPSVEHKNVLYGMNGILEAINLSKSTMVVNALVGFLGLRPTMETIKCGKKLALANKESLVVAGKFTDISKVVPIDSEHFAIWYLMNTRVVSKITITASGGPFRNIDIDTIKEMKAKDALQHPNWSMGKKISIDSATMTNKLFELLEAKWLFGIDNLSALIEENSIIHALIDFEDGSTTAHFARTDMKLPIAYALLGDNVKKRILPNINLLKTGNISFKKIETKRYPIWQIKDEVLACPDTGVVVNAANEIAVGKFLEGNIGFLDIAKIVLRSYEKFSDIKLNKFEDIFDIDNEVRKYANKLYREN